MVDMSKYKFFHFTNKEGQNVISAVSTYAGKTVKGYAKCDPRDSFSQENGEKLAAARCNARVAGKRAQRARKKLAESVIQLKQAQDYYNRMNSYYNDSAKALEEAEAEVQNIVSNL
jgi:cob(I)alamin adenosyltransferase